MKKLYIFLVMVITSFMVSNVYAQDEDVRDKIEDIKLEKLTKKLSLDESTKVHFIDKYKVFSKEMRALNRNRAKVYKAMAQNVESGEGLDTLVNQLLDYESTINQKRKDFIADLKEMLTPQQIAKMIIFERKFNNELKKLLKQYQKENQGNFKD